jgi:hypothetical protein
MRFTVVIMIFFAILVFGCSSAFNINGRYVHVFAEVSGEELRFSQGNNAFQYYSKTEANLREYSAGTWILKNKKIFLNGFEEKNINVLQVESMIENSSANNMDKIMIQYNDNVLDTFTKVDLIINEVVKIRIHGDTSFFTEAINTLQIKSYLVYTGILFTTHPKIDTLYSDKMNFANNKSKTVSLKVDVDQIDFYRAKLLDTLTIKNSRTLMWHKRKFKRIKE